MSCVDVPRKWSRGMYAHAYRDGWAAGYAARLAGDLVDATVELVGTRGLAIGKRPNSLPGDEPPATGKGSSADPYTVREYNAAFPVGTRRERAVYVAAWDGGLWYFPAGCSTGPTETAWPPPTIAPMPRPIVADALDSSIADKRKGGDE